VGKIQIAPTKDYFIMNDKPFFYLADTVWSVFTNATLEEWGKYLDYRKAQGFNALQIDILPQWDASQSDIEMKPFELDENGQWNFFKPNGEYFNRAQSMMEMAVECGFVPVLVVLWCNYVPDTWASKFNPTHIMPAGAVKPYVEHIVHVFDRYDPVYIISGDTDLDSDTACWYYATALDTIKALRQDALTTMHLGGGNVITDAFANNPNLDFYMYQSSHMLESQDLAYKLAEQFYAKEVKRPIVNGEPCYEGHAHGSRYGRFSSFEVRRAIWQSLLSGAKAGVTYGAHGIWSWHKKGKSFGSESFSGMPFDWETALRFPGAWDIAFAKQIFERYELFDLSPRQEAILNDTHEIRMSASSNKVVIYAPYNVDIKIAMDLEGYDWTLIELYTRKFAKPNVEIRSDISVIKMHDFNSDALFIGVK
jgi:hypothetical protein